MLKLKRKLLKHIRQLTENPRRAKLEGYIIKNTKIQTTDLVQWRQQRIQSLQPEQTPVTPAPKSYSRIFVTAHLWETDVAAIPPALQNTDFYKAPTSASH